jgi:hypothetical protein
LQINGNVHTQGNLNFYLRSGFLIAPAHPVLFREHEKRSYHFGFVSGHHLLRGGSAWAGSTNVCTWGYEFPAASHEFSSSDDELPATDDEFSSDKHADEFHTAAVRSFFERSSRNAGKSNDASKSDQSAESRPTSESDSAGQSGSTR